MKSNETYELSLAYFLYSYIKSGSKAGKEHFGLSFVFWGEGKLCIIQFLGVYFDSDLGMDFICIYNFLIWL